MSKIKILITGASGFVGTNLCKKISKSKYNIYGCYFRNKKFKKFHKIKYIKRNLISFKNCKQIN